MTTGTNLQLTYDEVNDSWSYQNVDYEYPSGSTNSWSGFTSPDPEFEYAPEQDDQEQDNDTVCPPGYIYDETLLQCVPDPNYIAPTYAGDPWAVKDKDDQPEPVYIDFRPMSYNEMLDFGRKEGYFNEAGTFIGAPESTAISFIKPIAQFGLDSMANRFAINFAKKGGKVWNPNVKGFKGNLYIPKTDDLAKFISDPSIWSNYAIKAADNVIKATDNVFDTKKITGLQIPPDVRTQTSGISEETDKELDRLDRVIKVEKLKQAENKTRESAIKVEKALSDLDTSGVTYTKIEPKDRSTEKGTGYTFTPKDPKPVTSKTYQHPSMDRPVQIGPRAGVMAPKPKSGYEARWNL